MIIYGTKIESDFTFPLQLPVHGETRGALRLREDVPEELRASMRVGMHLHKTHDRRVFLYSDRPLTALDARQPLCYEAENIVRFYWYHGEETVYCEMLEMGTVELLAFWFIHSFFPLYLTMEDHFRMMHCSAVMIDGTCVIFSAPYREGKSTLTDYFIRQGHTLVTDDILPTWIENDTPMCHSSFPYHRPFRRYETLGYHTGHFRPLSSPIERIYLLESAEEMPLRIEEARGVEKFVRLKNNGVIYTFDFMNLEHTKYLFDLLGRTKVYRLTRPRGLKHLHATYEAILAHHRSTR